MNNTSPFSLQNEYAIVTGGGTGLGFSIAKCLAAQGAKIAIVGRRKDVLEKAAAEIAPGTLALSADVTVGADRERIVKEATAAWGKAPTILVNNAGIHLKKLAESVTDEEFATVLQTHLHAAFGLSRLVAPSMRANKHGSILMIASMASYMGIPSVVGYTCGKSGVVGLTRSLASEWSGDGVRINAIAPGWIFSDMTAKALDADPARKAKVLGRTMMGRMGQPEEIGWTAAFLCSPGAGFITGAVLPVDGGASVGF